MKFYNTVFATPIIELDVKINNKKIINYIKKIKKYSSERVLSNSNIFLSLSSIVIYITPILKAIEILS